jgi:23S rRNA (cytosine1962-C5)-methyltransferase
VRITVGDAFEVMADLAGKDERYDVVVVDPPSFAHDAAGVDRALRAYGRLTRGAVDC